VVDYWNRVDEDLELELDVLDDLSGEGKEVGAFDIRSTSVAPLMNLCCASIATLLHLCCTSVACRALESRVPSVLTSVFYAVAFTWLALLLSHPRPFPPPPPH